MSKRELYAHKTNIANEELTVIAVDAPGSGGASHLYSISGFDTATNTSASFRYNECEILFQNGPIKESGVNGITHEALLAILIDRLAAFQDGAYKCEENGKALDHVRMALFWLTQRTQKRFDRGVEGTHTI